MKIVNRATFMTLPVGTVYCEYEPCIFGKLLIKGETIVHAGENIDWFYDAELPGEPPMNPLDMVELDEGSLLDFQVGGRDGGFADDQLYAVFELADTRALIARLQQAVADVEKGGAQ